MVLNVFTDFDGTITKEDTLVMVLDRFAAGQWRAIEDLVTQNKMTEREALQAEFDLVTASYSEVLHFLQKHVQIDATFKKFAGWCRKNKLPLTVLSGGFKPFIEITFEKFDIADGIQIYANMVEVVNAKWKIIPSRLPKINDLCNHCKTYHLVQAKNDHNTIVYIGNGNTDRCPAKQADVIFAKENLAQFLTENKHTYHNFKNFSHIQEQLQMYI
jgi:2-hydroxy-3-keto-5-methylthiopentenyl-1-phosphate phosphatase